ncbi:TetR/AcrR family transcriptional regulator [Microbacterium hydrocarbonoxydans]|uniref:TetR/AcrR family transcriptional regulator n=1 Tax=Microbacterium hydrocarbonoxydans TaxID=273678 RepID=UPI00203BE574|nr:TetR/AcrR family transcriptional regulator [Microbacterium hydrocarbonoxydans]MCM3779772.1 TetR family transcriptional regulator [Microbacterium hydrocarbonoxydans]
MKSRSRAATPRRLPPLERERSIVDAAVALAAESGLEALTVRAIAGRAGVAPALVAHYRPVMDAFVAEVFGAIVAAEREEVIASHDSGELRENLLHLIETLLDEHRDDVAVVWVQSWALGARNEALAARVRAEMDLWQSALEDLIARAIADNPHTSVDPASAAWMLLAMVDGMSAHSLVKWAPRDRSALARRTLAAVLDIPADATAPAAHPSTDR